MDSPQTPSQDVTGDIFSLSDQALSDRLRFIVEIGFGNWGSVWLCRPKTDSHSDGFGQPLRESSKIAVKLVHRTKTNTTAARVRSLWNEMKIVRTFKSDPHPSIIPFHSFIITPSYALITMAFLPTLVPVEVEELKAREWFRSLLSGVEFLHKRGVVHNDIKPANILLSAKNIPVLVDFGFAEMYDLQSSKAFHSNLSYGTPEYLSPERARGLPHDTRKSDVWSLGITFFEILTGRTPFEHSDGEQFASPEDLEEYWGRTLKGKWIGSWKMSKGMEKMLRHMISPNADLRCTASEAMFDPFWLYRRDENRTLAARDLSHRRTSSYTSSIVFEKDFEKLMDVNNSLSSALARSTKENMILSHPESELPNGLPYTDREQDFGVPHQAQSPQHAMARAKPQQPKLVPSTSKTHLQPKKRGAAPVLPSIPASPATASKENVVSLNTMTANARRPLGLLARGENLPVAPQPRRVGEIKDKDRYKGRALMELSGVNRNRENGGKKENANGKKPEKGKGKDKVKDIVREWEREKERLREMERLEELEKVRDEHFERDQERVKRQQMAMAAREKEIEEENRLRDLEASRLSFARTPNILGVQIPSDLSMGLRDSPLNPTPTTAATTVSNESVLNGFRHSVKKSIDKTVQLYKSSTLGQVAGRMTPARSLSIDRILDEREPWEDEVLNNEIDLSLPSPGHDERVDAESREDRMAIWMRNVEKVVEEARQNFELSSSSLTQPIALPLPISRSTSTSQSHTNRSSRLPRRVLAANQIFLDDGNQTMSSSMISSANTSTAALAPGNSTLLSEGLSRLETIPQTPQRQRRATVSTRSPEPTTNNAEESAFDIDTGSPSKRREKARSHGDLLQHISPISVLEHEIEKQDAAAARATTPRLSAMLDKSIFIAPPPSKLREQEDAGVPTIILTDDESKSFDELTSSPLHVEPYPPRKPNGQELPVPDSPNLRRIEGVYDRFLMATTGVKRVGKGYQSDNCGPVAYQTGDVNTLANDKQRNHRSFLTTRRPMPPPVSSADQRQTVSVDELGVITYSPPAPDSPIQVRDEGNTTATFVRRAFKAMVPTGKTVSRRLSRIA